ALESATDILQKETGDSIDSFDFKGILANEWLDRVSKHPTSWREGNPYRLKPNGEENPAFLALIGAGNELPAHWSGAQGESLPAIALKTDAGDITLFVEKYDVTTATDATRMSDSWMRNMFPGPLGDDGVPRWMPGRPLPVNSFDSIDAATLRNPSAVVETMHVGSYPGFQPGDYIAFDHAGKVPPWAQAATRMPGGAAREAPERGMARLGMERLQDADVTNKALSSNAWAVFEWPTKNLVSDLRREGFNTIPLQGDVDMASPAILVFGLDAEDAVGRGATHTHAVADTRHEREWLVPNRSGDRVPLSPHFAASQGTGTGRVSKAVARYAYKVDQREAHQINKLAADLENTGAGNLVVYSRQPHIDGFESARERAFRGPAATVKVVRTADGMIGESNSVPVHVRPGSGLPTKPLDIDPSEVSLGGVAVELIEDGKRGTVARMDVEVEGDLFNRLRDAAELAQVYGHDNVDVMFEGKRIPLFKPDVFPEVRPQVGEYDGAIPTTTRPPAPDDPNVNGVRIIQRFGPGSQNRLSPETQAGISQSLDTFMRDFPQVAEIWGLSWVSVDRQLTGKVKGGNYVAAVNQYVPGSGIHLNEERWMDEPKLIEHAKQSAAAGYTAVGTPAGIIAHELGHVMAATIRLLETGKAGRIGDGGSPLFDAVAEQFKAWATPGGGSFLSGRGKVDVDEALAEAFADVLVNGRGKTAFAGSEWLYDTMSEHLKTATPNKYKFWGAPGGKSTEALSPPTPDTPYVTVVDDVRREIYDLDNYDDVIRDDHRQRIAWQSDKSSPFGGNPSIRSGVESYLGLHYESINGHLRGMAQQWGPSADTAKAWVEGIREAFTLTGPVPDDIEYLYRGVSKRNRKRFFASKMIPGAEFTEHGLSSTAHSTSTPMNFVSGQNEYAIIRIRVADEMRDVNVLAGIEREQEWVLPPGSKFRVTEVLEERDEGGIGVKRLVTVDWIGVPDDAARGGTAQLGRVPQGDGEVSSNMVDDDDLLGMFGDEGYQESEGEYA
ncbi:MAG: hypothetical protein M3R09_05565, partial [Actinomycetota bacterium]|nr:hypothetical protein [Actinomycetota bacterium]